MWKQWKVKTWKVACILSCALLLSGCAGVELENKSFPLAVLVSEKEQQYVVCYLSQQLSEVSNERADGGNMTAASAAGSSYYETHRTFEKNSRSQLDMSHTKAIIFEKDFIRSNEWIPFLETVKRENMYARNTLVYLSDSSMDQMEKLNDTLEVPLGSYLEQMMENDQDIKEQAAVTLGALLNEQANESRILFVPVLEEKNGMPEISSYEVVQEFEPKGRISTQDAQIAYLLQGQLKQMDLQLDGSVEREVHLSRLKCKRSFAMDNNHQVTQHLMLTAEAECITGQVTQEEIEQKLQEKIEQSCRNNQAYLGIDLSDSMRRLAMYAPEVYQVYGNQTEAYRQALGYEVQVNVQLLSNGADPAHS